MTDELDSGDSLVLSEDKGDGVLLLTMNDPKTRNALGPELMSKLLSELDRFATDDDLRCLVITGMGTSFSSGANVRGFARRIEQQEGAPQGGRESSGSGPWDVLDPIFTATHTGKLSMGPEVVRVLHNLQKPSIAAVNGHAYGLGCGIAISCDLRIAAENARFSEAFIRSGLIPADGSTWQLPKLVGTANALWMQFSGEPVDGHEAFRIGLVNKVVPDDELLETALTMARRLAKGPVFAMGLIKQLVRQGYQQTLVEHLPLAGRAQALARETYDHKEGVRAFIEKREPNFRGH